MEVLKRNAVDYCEATTLHGFVYWVRAENLIERLFWITVTITSFTCAGLNISAAIGDWMDDPTTTVIQSFSKVTQIDAPNGVHRSDKFTAYKENQES